MKKILLSTIILAGLAGSVHALDLTPQKITAPAGGPQISRYFFQDGSKKLIFRVDDQMTVSGGAALVTFRFSDVPGAEMKIAKSPFPSPLPFDEKNVEAYRVSATGFVSAQATNVKLEEETADAIAINGWSSRQYTFTYAQAGITRRRTVTFITLNEVEQVVVDVDAPASAYEKTYARGYRVLNSLGEMKNDDANGPT